jgi:hypothetical protein
MTKKISIRFGVLTIMILLAALSRLIHMPPNFAPIGALALFGAAYFSRKSLALIIPLISLWISDLVLNNTVYANTTGHFIWFTDGFYWVYSSFILIALLGFLLLKKVKTLNIIGANLLAAILFFAITNFGSWVSSAIYPQNFNGLITCYVAGIPFFWNTLAGDIFYSAILFGVFELAQRKFTTLALTT